MASLLQLQRQKAPMLLFLLPASSPAKRRGKFLYFSYSTSLLLEPRDQCIEAEAHDRTILGLPGQQLALLQALRNVCGYTEQASHSTQVTSNIVVVLINGGPISEPWMGLHIPAIIELWLVALSSEGGADCAGTPGRRAGRRSPTCCLGSRTPQAACLLRLWRACPSFQTILICI
jgi:hypothetical protein